MMQRTGHHLLGRHPIDSVERELGAIVERRIAEAPPPGSSKPVIRPFVETDRPAITEMVGRCSLDTLRRRFHGPVPAGRSRRVSDQLVPVGRGVHVVAVTGDAVVGVGSLQRGRRGEADLAVIVEDDWQRAGVGRCIVDHLVVAAREQGVTSIVADILREPAYVLERFVRAAPDPSVLSDGAVATVRIPIGRASADPDFVECGSRPAHTS